ncbi:MAG: thioredoxin family protein [Bacteroidales bacterium]|nr:thioredoxin family protein [Bacteroidales bacterium]
MKTKNLFYLGFMLVFLTGDFSLAQETKCKLKVIYFHAENRCPTCLAIEKHAEEVLQESYKTQLDNGEITFKAVNVDETANRDIAKKYKVYGSALMLIDVSSGKEKVVDFTDQAFSYAKNEPDKYKELLKTKIKELIK